MDIESVRGQALVAQKKANERRARAAVKTDSFRTWVAKTGGLNPEDATFGGEVRDITRGASRGQGYPPGFLNKKAPSLDIRVEHAKEAGWLLADADENDFLYAVERGTKKRLVDIGVEDKLLKKGDKEMDFSKVGIKEEKATKKAKAPRTGRAKVLGQFPSPPWLKDCEICNTGLCKRMDDLTGFHGLPEREAARVMEAEAATAIGTKIWTAEQIRARYQRHAGGASRQAGTGRTTKNPVVPIKPPVEIPGASPVIGAEVPAPVEQAPAAPAETTEIIDCKFASDDPQLMSEHGWQKVIGLLEEAVEIFKDLVDYGKEVDGALQAMRLPLLELTRLHRMATKKQSDVSAGLDEFPPEERIMDHDAVESLPSET